MKKHTISTGIIIRMIICLMIITTIGVVNPWAKTTVLDSKINTDTGTADQKQSAIAVNRYGYTVVVWTDDRDGDDGRIYAQFISEKGLAFLNNFAIDEIGGSVIQQNPDVAMNDRGHFVVVWEDTREGVDVWAKMFYANGVAKGEAFRVNDVLTNTQTQPAVAMDSLGNFVVSWDDTRNGRPDIYMQRYNLDGEPIGENARVNTGTEYLRSNSDLILFNNGGCIITWVDGRNSGVGDIYMQWYNSGGDRISGNIEVSSHAGQETSAKSPSIAAHKNGDFIICWHFAYASGVDNIYGRLYNQSGHTLKDIYIINETDGGFENQYAAVSANPTDGYGVVWQTDRGGTWDIRGRSLAANGDVVGASIRINDSAGDQKYPCLGIDERGIALFAWTDDRNGNPDIFGTWSGSLNLQQWKPLNLYAGSDFDGIVPLSWDHIYGIPQIKLYHIYRSNIRGGPYTKITSVNLSDRGTLGNQFRDWIDVDVENNHYYYYVVTAEASGIESPYSNEATGNPHAEHHELNPTWASAPFAIDGHLELQWNDAELYFIDDRDVPGWVTLSITNNADFLYICLFDNHDDRIDANNMVNILFDSNNDDAWDATAPGTEGIITIMPTTTAFTGLWGLYPNGLGADTPIMSPTGVQSAMATEYNGLTYEIAINLHTSPLRAVPGQTVGFGIWIDDPGNIFPKQYGYSCQWPWGMLRETAVTLGDLVLASPTHVEEHSSESRNPVSFALHQNYPNPFNPETSIPYDIPELSHVRIDVYNLSGQHVKTLVDGERSPGRYVAIWDGRTTRGELATSGLYLYRLESRFGVLNRKLLLIE